MEEPPSIEALSIFAEAVQDLVTAGLEQSLGRWFACVDACNQAAEKALQSVSVLRTGHRAPYDHDLAALGAALSAPQEIQDDLAVLTPYHPEPFYKHTPPELADDAIEPEAVQDAMERARAVLRWARAIVVES
jgi:HEPN domain-containing protein